MAWLASNGYQTITPQQYTAWLAGEAVTLPAKPVLITFDDAFPNDTQATPVLQQYGFHAVMFVVTGYANAGLRPIRHRLRAVVDHRDDGERGPDRSSSTPGNAGMPLCRTPRPRASPVSTSRHDCRRLRVLHLEFRPDGCAVHEARVTAETTAGLAEIQQKPGYPAGWQSTVFAAPFGAWGNGDNPWLISYWDSIFSVVFVQYIAPGDQANSPRRSCPLSAGAWLRRADCILSRGEYLQRGVHFAGAGSGATTGSIRTRSMPLRKWQKKGNHRGCCHLGGGSRDLFRNRGADGELRIHR